MCAKCNTFNLNSNTRTISHNCKYIILYIFIKFVSFSFFYTKIHILMIMRERETRHRAGRTTIFYRWYQFTIDNNIIARPNIAISGRLTARKSYNTTSEQVKHQPQIFSTRKCVCGRLQCLGCVSVCVFGKIFAKSPQSRIHDFCGPRASLPRAMKNKFLALQNDHNTQTQPQTAQRAHTENNITCAKDLDIRLAVGLTLDWLRSWMSATAESGFLAVALSQLPFVRTEPPTKY